MIERRCILGSQLVRDVAPRRDRRVEPGVHAPDFTLPNQAGELTQLSSLRGDWVVLYFYPEAETPGCITQACGIRDRAADYQAVNAIVLGISPDPPAKLSAFADKYGLPFTLLSDEDHSVAERYGVSVDRSIRRRKYTGIQRSTFLIGPEGKIEHVFRKVDPAEHDELVLGALTTVPHVDPPRGAPPLRDRRRHGYESGREDVQRHVPTAARSILELGCSSGALGAALKARRGASVLGVEIDPTYAADAAEVLDRVVQTSAESFVAGEMPPEAPFDCVIAADVLEHLVDPWATLRAAGRWVRPGGLAVVSLPNVLYWRAMRKVLSEQRWPREDEGIFDRTHLRYFSWRDAEQLVAEAGFRVRYVEPQYWERGRGRARVLCLSHSPLAPFLPAQLIVVGEKEV